MMWGDPGPETCVQQAGNGTRVAAGVPAQLQPMQQARHLMSKPTSAVPVSAAPAYTKLATVHPSWLFLPRMPSCTGVVRWTALRRSTACRSLHTRETPPRCRPCFTTTHGWLKQR